MRTRKRFGKSRRLSTQEQSNELYNIECGGQAAQSQKIHWRHLSIWTIVLRSCKNSGRSSPESCEMREILELCQTSGYQITLTWHLLPPPIVVFFHRVFWESGKVFNRHGMHLWAHRSCGTLVPLGSMGILLRKWVLSTESYLSYC